MCGIAGLIGPSSPHLDHALARVLLAMAHRGPDDEGIKILPRGPDSQTSVRLGSRRLAIQDLSPAGHQPMHDPETGNWLVFNGEIYNFHEVRSQLEKLGHRFRSHGDTEVLLKSYAQWGEACLDRLAGMFAFALWDEREQRLFLARDRLGVKPLYYYQSPELFMFGSEVRALLASGLIPRRLDMGALASYLAFGAVQDPLTIVEGLLSVPPGHTLIWENKRLELRKYWSMAEAGSRPAPTNSRSEAESAIRGLLVQAVSQRLISDVPTGAFLSGGVDSSSIVAFASSLSSRPLGTFSVVFGDHELSESAYSDQVARQLGCDHHRIELTERCLVEQIPAALASMDQPSLDGVNTYVISRATKDAGITVALSGLGGDEIFAGYSSFRSVPKMMTFQQYAGWLAPAGRGILSLFGRTHTNPRSKLLALASNDYHAGHPYFLARTLFLPPTVRRLLATETDLNHGAQGRCRCMELIEQVRGLEPVTQVSVLEGSTYMANMLLRDTDCMSMAVSLEVRCPFLDHRLWEYVLPLAGKLKLSPNLPKPLLVRAAGQQLPAAIYMRPKMGFTLPFEKWLRNGLRQDVGQELLEQQSQSLAPLEPQAVAEVWKAYLAGQTSWTRPWSLFVLKRWVRRNLCETPSAGRVLQASQRDLTRIAG